MKHLIVLAALMATPAMAEGTSHGAFEFVQVSDLERGIAFAGDVYEIPSKPYLAFVEEQFGDWVLLVISQGGNACAAQYVWANFSPAGIDFSPVFGSCAELSAITQVPQGVMVEIPSLEVGMGPVAYVYDGAMIVEEQEPLQPIGWSMGQPGGFWEGQYVFDLLGAAEMDDPLKAIMDQETLDLARKNAQRGTPMEAEGDWIVGTACEQLNCPANEVAVAVSTDGARLVVAIREGGNPVGIFGPIGNDIIPGFEDVLAP